MYLIIIRGNKFISQHYSITCAIASVSDLFDMVCILNKSEDVIQYRICWEGFFVDPKEFGWGQMEKWVRDFPK